MCPSPPWFHHPERRLLAGFLGLLWSVLAGGCATTTAPVALDTIEEVSAAPEPEAPEYIPVVRYARYTLVELAPMAAQRDLLLHAPRSGMGCGTYSNAAATACARPRMP